MLKRENQSETHLVVGSLEVIGNVGGQGFTQIRKSINALASAQSTATAQLNDYWTKIASDTIITAQEKKTLKKEWQQIEQVYAAIKAEVEGTYLESINEWKEFKTSYGKLYEYLFNTLKLFDNMYGDTQIPDVQQFLDFYNNYYKNQQLMQSAIVNKKIEASEAGLLEDAPYTGHYRSVYYTWDKLNADTTAKVLLPTDWIMWGGASTTISQPTGPGTYQTVTFNPSYIYSLSKVGNYLIWGLLNPEQTDGNGNLLYSTEYMAGLTDILKSQKAGPGYFSTVFANAFFANAAAITALQTKTIDLQADGGMFKTTDYAAGGPYGFRLMSSAWASSQGIEYPIEFFGNMHVGGKCSFDGEVEIGSNAKFYGDIFSGPLYLSDVDPSSEEYEVQLNGYNTNLFYDWCNGQGFNLAKVSSNTGLKDSYLPKAFNGTIGGTGFSRIWWKTNTTKDAGYFRFETNEGVVVGQYKMDSFNGKYDSLPLIIFDEYTPGGKTFCLYNLPTSRGRVAGVIYKDAEGYLRVT